MPELPEVETVVRNLEPKILGKLCTHIDVFDKKLGSLPPRCFNLKIKKVSRLGKEILIQFSRPKESFELYLLIHLRMTGRLLFNKGTNQEVDFLDTENYLKHKVIRINSNNFSKHIRATFHFKNGQLHFFDVRRFGTFKWSSKKPLLPPNVIDPVSSVLTFKILNDLLIRTKKSDLKSFLLRQDRLVGIGNIYASEILFNAGLSPYRKCNSLSPVEIKKLILSIKRILFSAIKHNGTTFSDFQLDDASTGNFQNFLKVYGREKMPCPKCNSIIIKITQNQRSTFLCNTCQV